MLIIPEDATIAYDLMTKEFIAIHVEYLTEWGYVTKADAVKKELAIEHLQKQASELEKKLTSVKGVLEKITEAKQ